MNRHAMAYVDMARKVREELPLSPNNPWFESVERTLIRAESDLVEAYRAWRELMGRAAEAGSATAKHYLEVTAWDLT